LFLYYSYAENTEDWKIVISLFEERINNKFIDPLNLLINCGNDEGSGFSVVAIECLLIELFAAFRKGAIYNNRYCEENDPPYQFKDCQDLYTNFLTTVAPFNSQFSNLKQGQIKREDNLFSALEFYTDVRCGLLHEGKTKKNWTINKKPGSEKIGDFLGKDGNKLKIYRTIFLRRLENYLTAYILELKGTGEQNENLRRNFARKMDNLYGFSPNKALFEWWRY
jgi:hypothetical protein